MTAEDPKMMTSLAIAEFVHDRVRKRSFAEHLFARVWLGQVAWRQRQHLLSLDAAALDDIGIGRDEAIAEAARPIWDVPQAWLR